MGRYLVTGAAGFIGSVLARRLLTEGHEVWTIDNLSTGSKDNVPAGVHFIQGDCQDPKSIAQLPAKLDAILHFAGQSSGEISFDDPVYDLRTNTEATLLLVNYGLSHGCPRFIYASSMSVYGNVPDGPISEAHPCHPLSFYGVGKLASEHYLRIYQSKGLQPTALRLFNVYGAGQNMANLRQGMVSIFLAQALRSPEITVKGSPDRFRDFIDVRDVVDCVMRLLHEPRSFGRVLNVGTGVRTTVGDLLKTMIRVGSLDTKVVYSGSTPGDQKGIYADVRLIKREFQFTPKWTLEKGLTEMVSWAKGASW